METTDARALPVVERYHPHGSDAARRIAQDGLVLRVQVGSGVHGTAITGTDDRDETTRWSWSTPRASSCARTPGGSPRGPRRRRSWQDVELLARGLITLPVPQPALDDVLAEIDDLAARLAGLRTTSPLPDEPDRAWVDGWLHRSHLRFWEAGPS